MFDLKRYMKSHRESVDRFLEAALPPAEDRPRALHGAMRYSVLPGGKRLRPILCLAAADAVAAAPCPLAVYPAAAVELFHAYTLVHDDLPGMDNDDFRRGKPTCHKVFGEANAILAGDALLTLAFEVLAGMPGDDPRVAARLALELARAGGSRGVVGGQVEDIAHADTPLDADTLEFIHAHKTADLFSAATRMGGIAAGGTETRIAALGAFGHALGMAFQIVDDLLDAHEPDGTARPDGTEASCLTVYGEEGARRRAADFTARAAEALHPFAETARPLALVAKWLLDRTH